MRIRKLDPVLSSQIAAGEVVERPASAVKELIENSLDAGATRITLEFEEAGLTLIRVTDDGIGMSPEDARLSIERFATSKIRDLDDLGKVRTLGFRGEALPSIASCSRMCIRTNDGSPSSGFEIRVEGGNVAGERPAGTPPGTSVEVTDLFYNTPARLKFMKSRNTERHAILDTVQRLALAWPDVSFTVISEGKTLLRTGGAGLRNTIADIFGPDFAGSMLPVDYTTGQVTVRGFLGSPRLYRRTRDRQYFSVLKRPVRSIALSFALDEAFRGIIPQESRPLAVLDITTAPKTLDVNVHPTKAEVRFTDERTVRTAITQAARTALKATGTLVNTDESDTVTKSFGIIKQPRGTPYGPPRQTYLGASSHSEPPLSAPWGTVRDGWQGDQARLPDGWQYLGSVHETYLICKTPESLLIIDKHALMESLAYRELLARKSGRQELLVSEVVRLDPLEADAYELLGEILEEAGFSSRLIGERTLLVTSVPLVLGDPLPAAAVKEVLCGLNRQTNAGVERSLKASFLATAACHASVRAKERLSMEEAVTLIHRLTQEPEARVCPHGRPTVWEIGLGEINEFFGRTSR